MEAVMVWLERTNDIDQHGKPDTVQTSTRITMVRSTNFAISSTGGREGYLNYRCGGVYWKRLLFVIYEKGNKSCCSNTGKCEVSKLFPGYFQYSGNFKRTIHQSTRIGI